TPATKSIRIYWNGSAAASIQNRFHRPRSIKYWIECFARLASRRPAAPEHKARSSRVFPLSFRLAKPPIGRWNTNLHGFESAAQDQHELRVLSLCGYPGRNRPGGADLQSNFSQSG